MATVTLAQARAIIDTCLIAERSGPGRRIAIAVCDSGAHPLASAREDGAPPLVAHIAAAKAQTCVSYGKPTKSVMEWADETPNWFHGVSRVSMERMGLPLIGSKGGVAVLGSDGAIIGAVGIAGEAGDYDESIAVAAIVATGLIADAG